MNQAKTPAISFLMICAILSTGCSTTAEQNNPAEGGFLRGMAGVVGGQYDERIQKREEELAIEQDFNERLEARKRALEQESAEIEVRIGLTKERIAKMEDAIDVAIDQLSDAEGERREMRMELEIAQSRLNEFLDELDSTATVSDKEIVAINQTLDEYQDLVEANSAAN